MTSINTAPAARPAPKPDLHCPNCHSADHVSHVPHIHRAGWSNYAGTGWAAGYVDGHPAGFRTTHTGSVVTTLSAELDPRPTVRRRGGMALAGLFFLFCAGMMVLIIRVASEPQPSTTDLPQIGPPPPPNHPAELYVFVAAFAAMGICFLVPYFRANRWQAQVDAAMPRIYDVWQRAWLCQRCGGVFFPLSEAALGLPTGRLLSTGQLRYMLRSIGGIHHIS
jgi:hypothetical protein